jgi:potassium-dependent mechanosensitive channel
MNGTRSQSALGNRKKPPLAPVHLMLAAVLLGVAVPAAPAGDAAADSIGTTLERARAQLGRLEQLPDSAPLAQERRRAAAQLLALLQARREERDHASLLTRSRPEQDGADASSARLGEPPYRVSDVDALQDRLDALVARRDALEATRRGFDDELGRLLQAQREADGRLRQTREAAEADRDRPDAEMRRAAAELSELQALLAGEELARVQLRRQVVNEGLLHDEPRIAQLRGELAQARVGQRLAPDEPAAVEAAVARERQALATERARVIERVTALEAAAGPRGVERTAELDALRTRHETLVALEGEASLRAELWRLRASLSAPASTQARLESAERLAQAREGLQIRRQAGQVQLEVARAGLAIQQPATQAASDAAVETARLVTDLERLQQVRAGLATLAERIAAEHPPPGGAADVIDVARAWLARTALTIWHYELFTVTDTTHVDGRPVPIEYGITLGKSLGALLLFLLGYFISTRLARFAIERIAPRVGMSAHVAQVVRRWLSILMVTAILLLVLRAARIPLAMFAFLGGALAIGIGFGAQNIIRNVISGIIILFERKIRVGDIVTLGATSGRVMAVDLRATTVRDFDGIESIVPNSTLLETRVGNWSQGGATVRRTIAVGVAYGSDLRAASASLLTCARAHPEVLADPAPVVWFDDFGDDAVRLKLLYWVSLESQLPGPTIDSDLRFAIVDALRAARVAIAFPQRDVHLEAAAPLKVEIARGPRPP